jgi:hypothetical protein
LALLIFHLHIWKERAPELKSSCSILANRKLHNVWIFRARVTAFFKFCFPYIFDWNFRRSYIFTAAEIQVKSIGKLKVKKRRNWARFNPQDRFNPYISSISKITLFSEPCYLLFSQCLLPFLSIFHGHLLTCLHTCSYYQCLLPYYAYNKRKFAYSNY